MKIVVNDKDISELVISFEYSGDIEQRSRSLNLKYLYKNIDIKIALGDKIALLDDRGKFIFIGIILSIDISSSNVNVSIFARDILFYLSKNKLSIAIKDTATNIAAKLLREFNIEVDELFSTTDIVELIVVGDKCIADVIKEAYGEDYYLYAKGNKVGVKKKASNVVAVISAKTNLINVNHKASIEAMVNKVLIVDDKGNIEGSVENASDYVYGLMQEVYKKEENKEAKLEASKLLRSVELNSSIEALGNLDCISGNAIYLVDESLGIAGKYLIIDDKHSFSNGHHKMSLGLSLIGGVDEHI